ncbi:MAG: thioredoxin-disulfide reductase [Planctomycetota bacterium]
MQCDIAIIGGGPAALAAAIYAARSAFETKIVERAMVGGQSALTADIANYPGFPDGIGGQELSDRMRKQAERFGATFVSGEVDHVERRGEAEHFKICMKNDCIECRVVIVASGASPRQLGVPGEEEYRGRGVSYCGTCDGPFFRDKRLIVIGGGDSALKEALHLAKFASELTIVHRRDAFRAERIYQAQVEEHEKISVRWNAVVEAILGDKTVTGVRLRDTETDETEERDADGVFIFVGAEPNTNFLCNLIEADCGGHVETGDDMMTRIPGLFAIGDVRKGSYRQIATAVGEGATAAIAAEHYLSDRDAGRTPAGD